MSRAIDEPLPQQQEQDPEADRGQDHREPPLPRGHRARSASSTAIRSSGPLPHAAQRLAHLGDLLEEVGRLAGVLVALAELDVDDRRVIRPGRGDITTTRSDRYTASGIEWVTKTTVVPVSAQMPDQLGLHVLAGHLVERAERLVHEQQRRRRRRGRGRWRPAAACRRRAPTAGGSAKSDSLTSSSISVGPRRPLGLRPAPQLERQLDVAWRPCATRTGRPAGRPCRSPGRAGPGGPACR